MNNVLFGGSGEQRLALWRTFRPLTPVAPTAIGSPKLINEMLELASKQQIHPWITKRPLEDVNQAVVDMHNVSSAFSSSSAFPEADRARFPFLSL